MYKVGDYIVYKKDVCKINEIKEKHFNNEDYYCLSSVFDPSLVIEIPTSDKYNNLRNLITKNEVEKIIDNIPNIPTITCNDKIIENEYKLLLSTNKHEDLIKIIKTAYLRNKERLNNNKKTSDIDNNYFKLAEKYLYNEFAIVLGISYDDTKQYVIDRVVEIAK